MLSPLLSFLTLIDKHYSKIAIFYLMIKQYSKIKSPIIDINNHLNKVLLSFDSLNKELSFRFHLVDIFLDCFSFLLVNQKDSDILTSYHNKLINIFENLLINQDNVLIITNTSIKNNVATPVSHIYIRDKKSLP